MTITKNKYYSMAAEDGTFTIFHSGEKPREVVKGLTFAQTVEVLSEISKLNSLFHFELAVEKLKGKY